MKGGLKTFINNMLPVAVGVAVGMVIYEQGKKMLNK